ncbi:MAG: ABC transporter ATP-binding protein [Mycoplasmatales bacterium]
MNQLTIKDVSKKYENSETLSVKDFNIEVKKGEFIAFVGPSGCGKSTTLRMIAGLEEITSGEISIGDKVINEEHPKNRDIAMVFQNYALYPHMTVFENISFGLEMKKVPKKEIKEKVEWAADVLSLTEYLTRLPKDLSGGQRQRVALGRAIVRNPSVFLMDEPLSNLDAKLRVHMRNEITKLHKKLDATTVYVTHDQIEAMTMADRIVVMKDGIIQQIGTPMEVFENPANIFIASFIGAPQMNFIEVEVEDNRIIFEDGNRVLLPEGILKKYDFSNGKVILGIRPEHIKIGNMNLDTYKDQIVTEKIDAIERMGTESYIFIELNGNKTIIRTFRPINYIVGDEIEFVIDLNKAHFFDVETTNNLMKK